MTPKERSRSRSRISAGASNNVAITRQIIRISVDLLVKLPDLKVVQTENVGATLLPRLNLVQPGKDARARMAPVRCSS